MSQFDKDSILNKYNDNPLLKMKKDISNTLPSYNIDNDSNNLSIIRRKRYYSIYNKNFILPKVIEDKNFLSSKILWDNLDYSIMGLLDNIYMYNKEKKSQLNWSSYNNLFNKIKNIVINNDIFYLEIIKREFYNVNRDVILPKAKYDIPDSYINIKNTYKYMNDYLDNKYILKYKLNTKGYFNENENSFNVNIWPNYLGSINERSNNLKDNGEYNESIFKPYYRYMIPILIYQSYKSFMSYLGYNNIFKFNKISFFSKIHWIKSNNLTIFNFVVVRTLLDLLHYNYRSLIRVKPKYYYLNTVRYYGAKIRRLQFNTWIASVKYIKRLRKTPRHFWRRYNKIASLYYGRIVQSAELNTKRKILLPFIIYFEDLLYIIYGKWAILRLWPIKRYYLNSYILAERIMLTLVIRRKKWNAIKQYRKSARKLISIFRWFQIKKSYDYINEYNTRWPHNLINVMNDNHSRHYLNYSQLEFFNDKLEKHQILNTYPIEKNYLKGYLSSVNNHYIHVFYNYLEKLNHWVQPKYLLLNDEGKLDSKIYVRYWLKPLNTYIFTLKQGIDITGIRFRLGGRTGISASNARRFKKFYFFGNLVGARHYNKRRRKTTSLTNPVLRNTIKSNIDYGYSVGVNRNGCITLKIWLSSLFSSDIHELLLHLLRVKYLYTQLINRFYLVHSKLASLKYKWLLYHGNDNVFYIKDDNIVRKKRKSKFTFRSKELKSKLILRNKI